MVRSESLHETGPGLARSHCSCSCHACKQREVHAHRLGDPLATVVTCRIDGCHRGVAEFAADQVRQKSRWRTTLLIGDAVLVDRLATIATRSHVVHGTGKSQSQRSAHGLRVDQDAATATILDLTLCALVEHAGEFDAKGAGHLVKGRPWARVLQGET